MVRPLEPFEEVHIETSRDTVGVVVEMLGNRRGQMLDMHDTGDGSVHLTYLVPTRGLLGFRYQFLTATRGMGDHEHPVPRLPADGRDDDRPRHRLVGRLGARRDHYLWLEECRRARRAVRTAPGWRCTRAW